MAQQSQFSPANKNSKRAVLYYDDVNPASRMCLMCVELLEAPVERVSMDTLGGKPISASMESINFMYYVPTFIHRNLALTSCHAILIYLCEKWKNDKIPNLLPDNFQQRMIVLNRLFFNDNIALRRHSDLMTTIIREGYDNMDHNLQNSRIYKLYELIEAFLNEDDYIAGDMLTIADIAILATIESLDLYMPLDNLKSKLPALHAWFKKVLKLPMHKATVSGLKKQRSILENFGQFKFANKGQSSPRNSLQTDTGESSMRSSLTEELPVRKFKDEISTAQFKNDTNLDRLAKRVLSGVIGVKCKINSQIIKETGDTSCKFSFEMNCDSSKANFNNDSRQSSIEAELDDSFERKITAERPSTKAQYRQRVKDNERPSLKPEYKKRVRDDERPSLKPEYKKRVADDKRRSLKPEDKNKVTDDDSTLESEYAKRVRDDERPSLKPEYKKKIADEERPSLKPEYKKRVADDQRPHLNHEKGKAEQKRQSLPRTDTDEQRNSFKNTELLERSKLTNRNTLEQKNPVRNATLQQEKQSPKQKQNLENVENLEEEKRHNSVVEYRTKQESVQKVDVQEVRRKVNTQEVRRNSLKKKDIQQERTSTIKNNSLASNRKERKSDADNKKNTDENIDVRGSMKRRKLSEQAKNLPVKLAELTSGAMATFDSKNKNGQVTHVLSAFSSIVIFKNDGSSEDNSPRTSADQEESKQQEYDEQPYEEQSEEEHWNEQMEKYQPEERDSEESEHQLDEPEPQPEQPEPQELESVESEPVESEPEEYEPEEPELVEPEPEGPKLERPEPVESKSEEPESAVEHEEHDEDDCTCDKCVGCNLNINIGVPRFCIDDNNLEQNIVGIRFKTCVDNRENKYPSRPPRPSVKKPPNKQTS